MKHTRTAALAAVGVAAALSLTACGNGSGSTSGSGKGAHAKGSSSAHKSAASHGGSGSDSDRGDVAKTGSGKESTGNSGATSGSDATRQTGTDRKVSFCRTQDLAIDAVDAAPDATSGRINITMVNRGSATCSATGFAGVDIKDADHTSSPIERGHAQPRVTVLKPGDAAVFDLAYDIDPSGKSLASPTDLIVTPPNETHSVTLKWPAGAGDIKGAYPDVEVYPTHTTA
ncbi:DUF4232 domain-containing protein [Streptomyces sp. SID5785]|uniref:DUF4232 domain-containing protein n=1 Tax=Streptomyces sp. SID5785 TaxID=2690309 RepID=UPI0013617559|nr:DUF4232 domain-containing protein [Streptomyces sp. SID5785]MZD10304.1 DUF4232 domain-containing protein [Streptomyces sp. SID5785]